MTLYTLTNDLRHRVRTTLTRQFGDCSDALAALDASDPDDLIWSYLTCCECGGLLLKTFIPLVTRAADTEEFCQVVTRLLALHRMESHGEGVCDPDGSEVTAEALRQWTAEYLSPRGAK